MNKSFLWFHNFATYTYFVIYTFLWTTKSDYGMYSVNTHIFVAANETK